VGSLLSTRSFCDSGFTAVYTSKSVCFINMEDIIVLDGFSRPESNNLWTVDITGPRLTNNIKQSSTFSSTHLASAAVITEATGTTQQILDYYFATMGSCTPQTFIHALNDQYVKLPGLSPQMIRRYPPRAIAIAQRHLDQSPQGFRSTKFLIIYLLTTTKRWKTYVHQ